MSRSVIGGQAPNGSREIPNCQRITADKGDRRAGLVENGDAGIEFRDRHGFPLFLADRHRIKSPALRSDGADPSALCLIDHHRQHGNVEIPGIRRFLKICLGNPVLIHTH
jgi:hypothetical protein